ncbi:MAG TPA: transcription antitermination factor NusB [Polyangiaceae bacterium]|jgi:N utilization substance protein B|nr:transcription antitermination factor NusB [Polyangiaceae bacterium]
MGARTSGREAALQMLFAMDAAGHDADRAIFDFWREFPSDGEGRSYADQLTRGVAEQRLALDEEITKVSANWRLERMTRVDRNILRLASYELMFQRDIPHAVIIDEAVELAKRYGSENSPAFVNGLLDKLASTVRATG